MNKRPVIRFCSIGLAVVLTAIVAGLFLPARSITMEGIGVLSLESHIAVAASAGEVGSYPIRQYSPDPDEVTYYFCAPYELAWDNDPDNMVDGSIETFASTDSDGDNQRLITNTCLGTGLGTITKVELRVYGYGDGDDRIDLRVFGAVATEYETTPGTEPGWGGYVDITNDPDAPDWSSWDHVRDLEVYAVTYHKSGKANTMYCAKLEIRVTYDWGPPVADIDVGADPIDRALIWDSDYTLVDVNNPANASGILHSVQVFAETNMTGLRVGTFYSTNGTTFKCRDSEAIGDVTAGTTRTFTELSITVQEGDYIGGYWTDGRIESDTSGFAGVYLTYVGEAIDPGDEETYVLYAGDAISLYGYGDFAAEADISNAPAEKDFGTVSESTSYWSNGSAPTFPLDDGECYFTVTNNGDTCSITIKATNFTGGVGWTLAGSPDVDTVTLKAGKSGDANEAAMVILTTSDQSFISGLGAGLTKKWELKLETGTFTDGVEKTSTVTLTATLD